jgi:hypothetical protein
VKYLIAAGVVLAIAIGVLGIVAGEADDSPGLQLLGAVVVAGALALGVRSARRRGRRRSRPAA